MGPVPGSKKQKNTYKNKFKLYDCCVNFAEECLRSGHAPKDAEMSAELLTYLLSGDLGSDPTATLRGLPLAPTAHSIGP